MVNKSLYYANSTACPPTDYKKASAIVPYNCVTCGDQEPVAIAFLVIMNIAAVLLCFAVLISRTVENYRSRCQQRIGKDVEVTKGLKGESNVTNKSSKCSMQGD